MVPLGVHCLDNQILHPSLIATPVSHPESPAHSQLHRKYLMGVIEDQRKKERGECSSSTLPGDRRPFFPSLTHFALSSKHFLFLPSPLLLLLPVWNSSFFFFCGRVELSWSHSKDPDDLKFTSSLTLP